MDEPRQFFDLVQSMTECGVSDDECDAIWRLLAALLKLGEVKTVVEADPSASQSAIEAAPVAGACTNYRVDTSAATFGACKCGFPKAAHSAAPAGKQQQGATGKRVTMVSRDPTVTMAQVRTSMKLEA